MEKLGNETTLGYTIMPDPSALSVSRLKSKASATPFSVKAVVNSFNPQTSEGLTKTVIETTARTVGKHLKVPYLKQGLAIARQAAQLTEALNDSWGQGDLDQISAKLDELTTFLDSEETKALESFETLSNAAPAPRQLVGAAHMPMPSDNDLPTLQQQMKVARSAIKQSRSLLGRVSQYLVEKQHAA
jgi:insecticidal toxin complex protein TccC